MADSDPALEWWESDPESPGNLELTDIGGRFSVTPGLLFTYARGRAEVQGTNTPRPMFEVLPQ